MIDSKTLFMQTKELSLLLVEDYAPLRKELGELLEDFFKHVTMASNGSEALEIYQKQHAMGQDMFDLVISDIEMPEMNGVAFSKAVRDIDEDQKILILSAYAEREYLLELINLGISQFITKPIDHEELLKALWGICSKIQKSKGDQERLAPIYLGDTYHWDNEKLMLTNEMGDVALSRHELLLLDLMVRRSQAICTNKDIIHHFYEHGIDLHEDNVRNLVFKLRKKMPKDVIQSLYGMGYKLIPLNT